MKFYGVATKKYSNIGLMAFVISWDDSTNISNMFSNYENVTQCATRKKALEVESAWNTQQKYNAFICFYFCLYARF